MSVHREQISAELNLNTSVLGKAKRDIEEFAREGHSGFVHIGNGAREFHKTIHELAGQIPIVGTVIQAAFSGVGGIFVAATAAAGFFLDKLGEINKEMDARSLENMRATSSDPYIRQLEIAKKIKDLRAEQNDWLKRDAEAHNEISNKMREELDAAKEQHELEKRGVVTKEQGLALDVKSAQNQLDIITKTRAELGKQTYAAGRAANKATSAFIEAPEQALLPKAQDSMAEAKRRLDESITRRDAIALAASKVSPGDIERETKDKDSAPGSHLDKALANLRWLPTWDKIKDQASSMVGQPGLEDKLKEAEEEVKRNTEAYHKNAAQVNDFGEKLDDLKKKMDQARDSFKTLDSVFGATTSDLIGMQHELMNAKIAKAQNASLQGFMPSQSDFEKAPGPLGNMARRMKSLNDGIRSRLSMGDVNGAEAMRKELKGYDVPAGAMEPNWQHGGRL